MNYVKKMCILRQVKQGFSGDGKALSGLIKIEQYGKNLAVEVSIINFAPLVSGEYYCLLSDGKGKTEMLSLRGKSLFNILSDLDISGGFCGVVCYVKNEVVPIAYGINGNGSYDWRAILNSTLPPVFPRANNEKALALDENTDEFFSSPKKDAPPRYEMKPIDKQIQPDQSGYDDETVAAENYYEKENENEQIQPKKSGENARIENRTEKQDEKTGTDFEKNGNADGVLHPFKTDSDGYYLAIKGEIDTLFKTYPRDDTLNGAFSCCEWVRIKGDKNKPQYLVGVLYTDGKAKYICYALAAEKRNEPPEEIKNVCSFVPTSPYDNDEGFFVLFQSASTGECIKPERA